MARADQNDLADISFLLRQETFSIGQLRNAFDQARVPDVPELRQLFRLAQPKVLELARELEAAP